MDRTKAYLSKDDRVLEVGCGTGSTALLLADCVGHITASDISAKMIDIGRGKARDQQVANVDFLKAVVFDDRLANGSFDVVLAYNFLHLLENPEAAIRRIGDLLKPGGLFISKTVCLGARSRMLRIVIPLMQLVGRAPYVGFLNTSDVEAWMSDNHFSILESGDYPQSPPSRFIVAKKM